MADVEDDMNEPGMLYLMAQPGSARGQDKHDLPRYVGSALDEMGTTLRVRVPGEIRAPLAKFADQMEAKLQKNDHKTGWHSLPVEALFRLLLIEIEEFKVAREYLSVAEARKELVDIANFSMILWDRLSTEDQGSKVGK